MKNPKKKILVVDIMCSKIYIEDLNVLKMFIDKWVKYLKVLEKGILKLELHSKDNELLNNIFECVHSIKGGSSFVGLWSITRLSYEIEITLEAIRNLKLTVNTGLIDSMLLYVDFLNDYIKNLLKVLKEQDFKTENGIRYLEVKHEQKEEVVLKSLKSSFEDCETKDIEGSNTKQETLEEEKNIDILESEEFKLGLANGIKEQFIIESTEHIERMENDLLMRLDTNSDDREAINEIFRAVHSVKGGTGIYLAVLTTQSKLYIGLTDFLEVVHTFESLLTLIRDKECMIKKNLLDLSFMVIDYLKSFINSVDSEEFINIDNNVIIQKIKEQILNIGELSSSLVQTTKKTIQEVNKVEESRSKGSINQSIRVNQDKLDKMMNTISELIIAKNSFIHISAKLDLEYNLSEMSKEVKQVGTYVNRISEELQNAIMSIRMVEIKIVFQKMPRVIRDIAQNTGKKMELFMEGENTEIDKTIIEQISDPLVHLIRNSADHGVEDTEERLSKGKPETGSIILRAYNKNKHVFIEIEDDGRGIDTDNIKRKAIEKGIISEEELVKMNEAQLMNLIFLPGFSMAKKITEISGRGVGMDIVKSNISKINGKITIESEVGKGTKITIQLPLTLAVSRGLTVEVDGETYIFPLEYIVETVKIGRNNIHKFNGKFFTYLRGEAIGIEWLSKIFLTGDRDTESEEVSAVILSRGTENYAIAVDKLKNEQEFVVKTLEGHLADIPGISGSTLLGNGQVVLIVNPVDILQLVEK
ncbi:chemotaxis protein CheA [Clostridium estertheticum]|uniref:chemotaxis protein CheW n=1 Tax=Clostridium estertheticum TaxID=238834 RepID=UPI001CF2B1DF|nr:chemotaxis protein CheA [Clostridium estertheticum]MCB2306206.1 chemotaxis protein CheA [Clostridium estertheticum]MCB2344379.1 chemotaxis protein CheA [Clostridium estertheticum]MCB2349298.1 chemotaxis protein CheA [Clostridium estertheticum]WAG45042.1 chemotaxis protein CheA [Clostridium estertheticum]